MTDELRHIHTGMMADADNAALGFDIVAITGDGRDVSAWRSSTSLRGISRGWGFSSCSMARSGMVKAGRVLESDSETTQTIKTDADEIHTMDVGGRERE